MSFSSITRFRQRRPLTELVVLVFLLAAFAIACSKQESPQPENKPLTESAPVAQEIPEPEDPLKEARADAEGKAHGLIMPITEQAQGVTSEIEVMTMNSNQAPPARKLAKIQDAPTGHFVDEAKVKHVLSQNHGAMKNCYERSLRRDPSLRGRVVLKLVIGTNGKVSKAKVQGETLHDQAMNECMEIHARTMTFPEPVGGAAHTNFPYSFSPQF